MKRRVRNGFRGCDRPGGKLFKLKERSAIANSYTVLFFLRTGCIHSPKSGQEKLSEKVRESPICEKVRIRIRLPESERLVATSQKIKSEKKCLRFAPSC
jgi:hypothetical protein